MFYFPDYKHCIQHPKQAWLCLLRMMSFSDRAPTSCFFSSHSAPIGLVNFLLLISVPIAHCGFLPLLALPLFSVFVLLFFILPFFPLSSSPFLSSIPTFLVYKSPHAQSNILSSMKQSHASPEIILPPLTFAAVVVFSHCPYSPSVESDPDPEPVKAQPHMLMAISFYPHSIHPVTFYRKSHQGSGHLMVCYLLHTGVWVTGAMNLGHEQQAAVTSVARTHRPSECILSFGCHVP